MDLWRFHNIVNTRCVLLMCIRIAIHFLKSTFDREAVNAQHELKQKVARQDGTYLWVLHVAGRMGLSSNTQFSFSFC